MTSGSPDVTVQDAAGEVWTARSSDYQEKVVIPLDPLGPPVL
jgi:hypothetical protein